MKIFNIYDKEKCKVFGIIVFLVYLAYSLFLNFSFTPDHVWAFTVGAGIQKPDFVEYLSGGRPAVYILVWIEYLLDKVHINANENQYVYQLMLIFLLAYAVYQLYNLFLDVHAAKGINWGLIAVLLIGVVNPYIVESFVFKAIEWGVAINIVCLAIRFFCGRHYIYSLVFLWFGVSVYQSYFSLFLIYVTAYLYMKYEAKLSGKVVAEAFKMFVITGICTVSNVLFVKAAVILGKVESEVKAVDLEVSLSDRLLRIADVYDWAVIKSYGEMFPEYFMIAMIVVSTLMVYIFLLKKKYHIIHVIYFLLIVMALNLYPFAVYFVAVTTGAHQRITWTVFASVSVLMLLLLFHAGENGWWRKLSSSVLIIFWCVNIFYTTTTMTDYFISNKLDEFTVAQILSRIEEYEEKTGVNVRYIGTEWAQGKQNVYAEFNLSYTGEYYGFKTMSRTWSDVLLINYLSGKEYIKVPMDEDVYDMYFRGKSWETFNADEQLVFDGDTMYWAIY